MLLSPGKWSAACWGKSEHLSDARVCTCGGLVEGEVRVCGEGVW